MKVHFEPRPLREVRLWEYALRFAFGGAISFVAGALGAHFGEWVGGVMLAFPAILPASLTLVKQHDGRQKACDDARGAQLGALGLTAFGATVGLGALVWPPPIVLGVATLVWALVSGVAFYVRYGRQPD